MWRPQHFLPLRRWWWWRGKRRQCRRHQRQLLHQLFSPSSSCLSQLHGAVVVTSSIHILVQTSHRKNTKVSNLQQRGGQVFFILAFVFALLIIVPALH